MLILGIITLVVVIIGTWIGYLTYVRSKPRVQIKVSGYKEDKRYMVRVRINDKIAENPTFTKAGFLTNTGNILFESLDEYRKDNGKCYVQYIFPARIIKNKLQDQNETLTGTVTARTRSFPYYSQIPTDVFKQLQ